MTKSELLLGRLIEERLVPGADLADVDRRIRTFFEEEWCIAYARLAGPARAGPALGLVPWLCLVHELKRIARPIIESHGGFIVRGHGDSFLVLLRRPPDGLACLLELHRRLAAYGEGRPPDQQLALGTGLAFGRILKIGDEEVHGAEVNAAILLGESARPGEILVTDSARAALLHSPSVTFTPLEGGTPATAFHVGYDLSLR